MYMSNQDEFLNNGDGADYFLSSSTKRYLSSGFKRTRHFIRITSIDKERLTADLFINWPNSWSEKKGDQLKPHVGTLDYFLFSERLVETYLKYVSHIKDYDISQMWIKYFSFKAGSECIDTNSFKSSCILKSDRIENGYLIYQFEISISNANVNLAIQLPQNTVKNEIESFSEKHLTEDSYYYFDGYKRALRNISNISIDTQKKLLSANYELKHFEDATFYGIGEKFMPAITFCDLMLGAGQLSQVLLYEMDHTNREKASNLWLRRVHSIYNKPIYNNAVIKIIIEQSKSIKLKGLNYTCADIVVTFNNDVLIANCNFAYQPFQYE